MNISDSAGLRDEQSASLPGRPPPSSALLRRVRSRADFAAMRARDAAVALVMICFASGGCSSSQSPSFSFVDFSTMERISVLPSLVLV